MARVGLVVVSHSDLLARGVVEVAAQMAPDVPLLAAGGLDEGGIGTSYARVEAAVEEALAAVEGAGSGVVLLTDLGSATLTVESVIEMVDDPDRVLFADAPLVEGAVAAAVRAQLGDDLHQVAGAAREAARAFLPAGDAPEVGAPQPLAPGDGVTRIAVPPGAHDAMNQSEEVRADAVVADPVGLHARPAALLARLAGTFDAEVTVDGADAGSVLEIMALGVRQGQRVRVGARGPQAAEAVSALVAMLENPSAG